MYDTLELLEELLDEEELPLSFAAVEELLPVLVPAVLVLPVLVVDLLLVEELVVPVDALLEEEVFLLASAAAFFAASS